MGTFNDGPAATIKSDMGSDFQKFCHLFTVLQLLDPETSSLEAAAVRQVWGDNKAVRLPNTRDAVHYKQLFWSVQAWSANPSERRRNVTRHLWTH